MDGSNAETGIVTTARKTTRFDDTARDAARRIGLPFVPRGDTSFAELFDRQRVPAIYVFTDAGPYIRTPNGKLVFHEGSSVLRTRGAQTIDPIVKAAALQPRDRVLDATLGLAFDSLVMAFHLREGGITGIERHPMLADMVRNGLREGPFSRSWLKEAGRRIEVINADHREFMRAAADRSFDVVYFDPMFAETVTASKPIQRLREFACNDFVAEETLRDALRVARRCVVMKARRGCFEGIKWSRHEEGGRHVFYGVLDAG